MITEDKTDPQGASYKSVITARTTHVVLQDTGMQSRRHTYRPYYIPRNAFTTEYYMASAA